MPGTSSVHGLQGAQEIAEPSNRLFERRVSRRIRDPDKAVHPEARARGHCHMGLGQETPGKVVGCFQAVPEKGSDIRIDIKGALRVEAADARELIQGRDEKIAPALITALSSWMPEPMMVKVVAGSSAKAATNE